MKTLLPLRQFVCDTCSGVIKSPEEGWLEWIYDSRTKKAHSFRICHHQTFSPLQTTGGCYRHGNKLGRSDMHLNYVLENRMAQLLQFVDVGQFHEPDFVGPHVADLREWSELARRLTIPFYEQARRHWKQAHDDGYFDGANEVIIYTEGFLKGLVKKYATTA